MLRIKIPNVIDLVKRTGYGAKISEIQRKHFTISDYKKFTILRHLK